MSCRCSTTATRPGRRRMCCGRWSTTSGTKLFGTSPTYIAALDKGGIVPKERAKLASLESVTLAGSPVTPEVHGVDLQERQAGPVGGLRQRWHRCLHRLRDGRADPAGVRRRDPGARTGLRRLRIRRAWREDRQPGGRAGGDRAHAVHAGVLLERRGQQALPRVLLPGISRASGATAISSG